MFLLITSLASALAVPHLVDGHLFTLSTPATQTVVLGLNLAVALLFLRLHRNEVKREQAEKHLLETRLDSSFRYIGRANLSLALAEEFSSALSSARTKREADRILHRLHRSIAVSVARATASRIRLISLDDGRTITEFEWAHARGAPIPRISNAEIVRGAHAAEAESGTVCVSSDYRQVGVACVFRASIGDRSACNRDLLRALINQFHLLYLLSTHLVDRNESDHERQTSVG